MKYLFKHCQFLIFLIFQILIPCIAFAHCGALIEPRDGTVYHGVGWGNGAQIEYSKIFPDGHQPLLFQNIFAIPGGKRPLTVERLLDMLRPNHIDPDRQFMELSVQFSDEDGALDSVFAFTEQYDNYIDTLAKALILNDRPVFLRIGLEMNGIWNGYSPWIFPKAYRKLVLRLCDQGADDFATVWCYEPDAQADFADSTEAGWKWYPGDDVVDWFGLDLFDVDHFDPDEPDSIRNQLTKKGRSEAFLRFSDERCKPVYLNELSARKVNILSDRDDPDSTEGIHDWETWFEPFFRFLKSHPNIKAFNYINLDWTKIPQYADWGDSRIEINSTIRNRWIEELSDSCFLNIGADIKNSSTGITLKNNIQHQRQEFFNLIAFPNPFNSSVNLKYTLTENSYVNISVLNVIGRTVLTLDKGIQSSGSHVLIWKPENLSSGVYIICLRSNKKIIVCKVILMK